MKVLIIEDEELAVKKLRKTLESVDSSAEVVGVADSIRSSVNWLEQNPTPDLILMDIELVLISKNIIAIAHAQRFHLNFIVSFLITFHDEINSVVIYFA